MKKLNKLKVAIIGQYPKRRKEVFTGIMRVIYGLVNGLKTYNLKIEVPSRGLKRSKNIFINIQDFIKFLQRLLRSNSDIFHIHGVSSPMFLAFIIGKLRRKKTIYTAHGLISREKQLGYEYSPIYSFYEVCFINFSDRVTTVSEIMRKTILIDYRIDRNKIIVIENGVDSSFIEDIKSYSIMKKRNKHFILFIGGTRWVKGLPFLLDSIEVLSKKRKDIVLIIVGKKGDQHDFIISKYSYLLKKEYVRFMGVIPENELYNIYKMADLVVLPSIYEPFGLVVLEAMAKGKAVIVSDRVGASSIITNMKDGIIVPYGDVKSLVKSMKLLIKNPKKRRQIGSKARKTAKKHTWERIAKKYLNCYKLLSGDMNYK